MSQEKKIKKSKSNIGSDKQIRILNKSKSDVGLQRTKSISTTCGKKEILTLIWREIISVAESYFNQKMNKHVSFENKPIGERYVLLLCRTAYDELSPNRYIIKIDV